MHRSRRPSDETILKAIRGSNGIVSVVSRRLKVEWHTADKWIKSSEVTYRALLNEVEKVSDVAETELMKKITSGDAWALKFWLTTKGRKRGFITKTEIAAELDGEINVNIVRH